MKTKKALLVMASLMATATLSTAIGLTAVSASTDTPVTPTTFTLDSGASVFTESSGNGLAYTLSMEKSNYENFMAEGYEDVTFGVLIAPEVYHVANPLNEENVFGANGATAVYDWATWNEDEGNWNEYTGTKTRIINIYAKALKESENAYTFRGAVTKLEGNSITGEYRGVGYVTYKDDNGATQYKVVTGDNVRTMHNVAEEAITAYQAAIDENKTLDGGTLDETTKTAYQTKISNLQTNYIAKANKINYTVTHHFVRADGTEYTQNDTVNAALNAPVTATPVTDNEYFTFDENNAKNELTGKATSATVLDVYYTQNTKAVSDGAQLLDVDATTTLSVPAEVTGDILNVCIDGVSVNESIAESTVTLKNVSELATDGLTALSFVTDTGYCYTQEVDVYTLLNFTSENFAEKGTGLIGYTANHYNAPTAIKTTAPNAWTDETLNADSNVYKMESVGDVNAAEAFGVAVSPRHSNSYYSKLNTAYSTNGLFLYYRFRLENTSGSTTTRAVHDLGSSSMGSFSMDTWYTVTVNISDLTARLTNNLAASDKNNRLNEMRYKYSYAAKGEKLPSESSSYWTLGDTSKWSFNSHLLAGYLLRFGQVNMKTNVYVTEPTIVTGDTFKLLDVNLKDNIFASDIVDSKFANYNINKITIDGTTTSDLSTAMSAYDLSDLTEGTHTVTILAKNPALKSYMTGSVTFTVFNGTVDVYNSADGVVLNYVDADKIGSTIGLKQYGNNGFKSGLSVVANADMPESTEYKYVGDYYYCNTSSYDMLGLWVKPIHSLAYYEMMQEKGKTGVSFDFYVTQTSNAIDSIYYNSASQTITQVDAWYTATLTLENIIANYSHMSNCSYNTTADGSNGYRKMNVLSFCEWGATGFEFYVGNFRSAN